MRLILAHQLVIHVPEGLSNGGTLIQTTALLRWFSVIFIVCLLECCICSLLLWARAASRCCVLVHTGKVYEGLVEFEFETY